MASMIIRYKKRVQINLKKQIRLKRRHNNYCISCESLLDPDNIWFQSKTLVYTTLCDCLHPVLCKITTEALTN